MDEILTSSEKTLLKTSLSEESFAKTKFSRLLDEQGFIVKKQKDGKPEFIQWKFTGSKTIDDEVFFEGEKFEGETVSSILLKANEGGKTDSEKAKDVLYSLVEIYTSAIENSVPLPCSSVFGILFKKAGNENKSGTNKKSEDGKKNKESPLKNHIQEEFLFVPEKTFDRCAANLGKKDYTVIQEPWRNAALTGKSALCFSRAVLAYFSLTKNLPYPPQKTDKSVNISYQNFIPLEYAVNGIDRKLSACVNKNLSVKDSDSEFPLFEFKEELFSPEKRKPECSEKDFEKKKNAFLLKQRRKITRSRKFNRIKGILAVSALALIFVSVFTATAVNENSKKPTTIGLDSSQTTEVFYQGIHKMDTDLMLASAKNCPEAQSYISRIPQIYVVANMKSAYNFESGISTPENWMFFEPASSRAYSHFIYGITNFTIDGKPSTLNSRIPSRKNHKPRLRSENGKRLDNLSRAEHKVHYWLVHNVDNRIQVDEYTTKVNLKWIKNSWQISFLEEASSSETVEPEIFSAEYKSAFEQKNGDYFASVLSLKEKYPWLPSEKSLQEEKEKLDAVGYFF